MSAETVHIPILVEPIVSALIEPFKKLPADAPPHWIVDCTLGGGGHTGEFLKALASDPALSKHKVLSVDQDPKAVEAGRRRFAKEIEEGRLVVEHSRFSDADQFFEGKQILGLMADLGFSSDQLESDDRGISFMSDGPLDMRLDPTRGQSCRDYLLTVTQPELEKVLSEYGEERFSRRIAQVIVDKRREKQMPRTARELADLIVRAVPPPARHGRIHAATRTFQALRIVVNEELNELDSLLSRVILGVKPGGRVAILSFHSLEDRRVKLAFRGPSRDEALFEPLTKKPIEADEEELRRNSRARSAKLRIAERR
jgi:16S rRNA (cytosine1402-N4)-methyltransferase